MGPPVEMLLQPAHISVPPCFDEVGERLTQIRQFVNADDTQTIKPGVLCLILQSFGQIFLQSLSLFRLVRLWFEDELSHGAFCTFPFHIILAIEIDLTGYNQGNKKMPLEQIIVLALIQGITEFLPISSSGHLAILSDLTDWKDQGIAMDVMMHVGSLAAIIVYFWGDVLNLAAGGLDLLRLHLSDRARLALYIVLATIPAVLFGLLLKSSGYLDALRADPTAKLTIIGWTAIIYGTILYLADRFGPDTKRMEEMKLPPALLIGIAQMFALIPGTSRSGITISAARFLGFSRPEAARFSFLLGMPAIAGAGLLTFKEAYETGATFSADIWLAAVLSFVVSFAAIAFLMALVKRMSFAPFVIYRLILGAFLLSLANGYIAI